MKLRPIGARYLLETVESGAVLGRYSFIGLHPLLEIECSQRQSWVRTADGQKFAVEADDPTRILAAVLELLRPAASETPGNLLGGAVGYLSYEFIRHMERVPRQVDDGAGRGAGPVPRTPVAGHVRPPEPQAVRAHDAARWQSVDRPGADQ